MPFARVAQKRERSLARPGLELPAAGDPPPPAGLRTAPFIHASALWDTLNGLPSVAHINLFVRAGENGTQDARRSGQPPRASVPARALP
jgi:hypothetical protein